MSIRRALVIAAMVWLLVTPLSGCGGSDLTLAGSFPTATPLGPTPTPGGCVQSGQSCDNITLICCSPLRCTTFGICQ